MALYRSTITMVDISGNPASFELAVNAANQADAVTALQGAVEALNDPTPAGEGALPLTLGRVASVNISIPIDISAWDLREDAHEDSENQKGGRFVFYTAGNYTMRVTIPTFNEALKQASGYLDINNPAVFSFYSTAMIGGGFSDYRGDDIDSLKSAYMTYGGRPAFK